MNTSYRTELLDLLLKKSFKRGEFILASGKKSNYYVDARLTTLDARGGYLIARIFLAMLTDDVPDAVGGLTLGADPIIGSMLALAAADKIMSPAKANREVPGMTVARSRSLTMEIRTPSMKTAMRLQGISERTMR